MPDIIGFDDAIIETKGEHRALLVGNGFSAQYFTYANLLAESGLEAGKPLRNLFDALATVDFEKVVRALEDAALVERAYDNEPHAEELGTHAQEVREALVRAVHSTHPAHRDKLAFQYDSNAAFLGNFDTVFSLNYDLLLYWVALERGLFSDGFGLGERADSFIGPFSPEGRCSLFNLHGGLHLFDNGEDGVFKALNDGDGVIATIADTIIKRHRLPLYVAEGTSAQKLRKIHSIDYLRRCYQVLQDNRSTMFVYGHSADENDAHIYRAIFGSGVKRLYFGIFEPNDDKVRLLDGQLAKYQKIWGSDTQYSFYDSASAKVWDA